MHTCILGWDAESFRLSALMKRQENFFGGKKKAARARRQSDEADAAADAVLGESGGPWEGQRVRLVASDLPELFRNSPAEVSEHYSSGLLSVQTFAGNVRTYKQSDLYLLTGDEA